MAATEIQVRLVSRQATIKHFNCDEPKFRRIYSKLLSKVKTPNKHKCFYRYDDVIELLEKEGIALTIDEAMEFLHCSRQTIYNKHIEKFTPLYDKFGKSRRFLKHELEVVLSNEVNSAENIITNYIIVE